MTGFFLHKQPILLSDGLNKELVCIKMINFDVMIFLCVFVFIDFQDSYKQQRLGKKADHPRPLLVELSDGSLKGVIFRNLHKLANHPEESFRKLRMKHDMTKDERERAKLLYEQAKAQEMEDQGKFRYRVRGPPWDMKIVKVPPQH